MTYTEDACDPILAALSDPMRRRIIETLRRGPSNVAALARDLPVSRPAVSQHLKVLADAGLVTATPQGTSRIYSLHMPGFEPLRLYLDGLWDDAFKAFSQHIEKELKND